jgi:hypothetical protein
LLVFGSTAAIDSVERSLERRMGDAHVSPAAEGVISLEARAPALAASILERSPSAARLLQRGTKLRGQADLGPEGLRATLELGLDSEASARETAEAAALLARALAARGGGAELAVRGLTEAVGESVVARIRLSHEELAALMPPEM